LQEQLLEQNYPQKVYPTKYNTAGDSNENTNNKSENSASFEERRPSYDDFHHPVNTGNKQKEKLYKAIELVKP
jgi:hypothetical protein